MCLVSGALFVYKLYIVGDELYFYRLVNIKFLGHKYRLNALKNKIY